MKEKWILQLCYTNLFITGITFCLITLLTFFLLGDVGVIVTIAMMTIWGCIMAALRRLIEKETGIKIR